MRHQYILFEIHIEFQYIHKKQAKLGVFMLLDNNKNRGRAGMSLAIAYYGSNGYTVSIPLSDTQWYDLVIEKDGIFQTVQCKCTTAKDGAINLKSCGGTNGSVYDSIKNHPIDFLFCLNGTTNIMYSIPVQDIPNEKAIMLRTHKNKSNYGFNTCDYIVTF